MIHVLTAEGARTAEERAVAESGVTIAELMDRAGVELAREVGRREPYGGVGVVAGRGNNGGDGWVAARELVRARRDVQVITPIAPADIEGPAGEASRSAVDAGVRVLVVGEESLDPAALAGFAVVVDALFGIGFSGEVRPPYATWIEAMNASGATIVAADLPSGVDGSTGYAGEHAVRATATVTFSAPKVGTVIYPGAANTGELMVADIGIPWEALGSDGDPEVWDVGDYRTLLPRPQPDTHKNMRGRVLVVAGSGAFPGAAALAVMGAQRMGAGYVTVAVPESVVGVMQTKLTSAVVMGLPENPSRTVASKVIEAVLDVARDFDAVVLGPGMTVAHGAVHVARALVSELDMPLVVDADGLNALVEVVETVTDRTAPTVITPHPGELARLLNTSPDAIQADRLAFGRELSGPRLTCVLKGAHTVISGRGRQVVTLAGNPGLATAGTGDVLAGMAGALLAQGLEPFEAGALAAYLHGRAGDHARAALTTLSMVAEDLPGYIPAAINELDDTI